MKREENMMLQDKSIHRGNLILINSEYPIVSAEDRKYIPIDRKTDGRISFAGNYQFKRKTTCDVVLEPRAASVLAYVFRNIDCGNDIVPVSGYRSKEEQEQIYEESIKENGVSFTRQYVALPGHSEHQTGLAVDLGLKKAEIDFICPDFPYEGICQDFRRTAAMFGFVERYKKEKEKITGISHEPWHFRYVGYPHSEIMEAKGFSLEEYVEYIKGFECGGNCVRKVADREFADELGREKSLKVELRGQGFEVFYVREDMIEEIGLPEDAVYEISGNNVDGYIVTVWRGVV